jgi:hypothetical protein
MIKNSKKTVPSVSGRTGKDKIKGNLTGMKGINQKIFG